MFGEPTALIFAIRFHLCCQTYLLDSGRTVPIEIEERVGSGVAEHRCPGQSPCEGEARNPAAAAISCDYLFASVCLAANRTGQAFRR